MADLPAIKSPFTLYKDMKDKISRRTSLTNFSSDSGVRALCDAIVSEDVAIRNEARRALLANQFSTAEGKDLEAIGAERLSRIAPSFAAVTVAEENLAFYADATFGAINGGATIVVPVGTIVNIPRTPSGETLVSYALTSACTCPAGGNIAFCSAKAASLGADYNVRSNSLTVHSFTAYSDSINNSLKITNFYPILNGRNLESTEAYRYRLANYFSSLAGASSISLKLSALTVPGAVEVKILPGYYGVGTVAVAVFGAEGESNSTLVQNVQRRLMTVQTGGLKAIAIPGIRVEFDFDMNLIVSASPTIEQRNSIIAGIRRSIQNQLKDEDSVSFIDLEKIRQFILSENKSIIGVISKSSRKLETLFDAVYVRRSFATELYSSERELVTSKTYTLAEEEFASAGTVNVTFEVRS